MQKGFDKHGADFGLSGGRSAAQKAEALSRAIHPHINSAGVQVIQGTYRGAQVLHYLNASTGLNVMADPSGNFVGGWKLGAAQLQSVVTTGRLF